MFTATTREVLEARGVRSRKVLWRDRVAGLFDDLLPRRTSAGYWSVEGVWLVWPAAALRRAREIRRGRLRGMTREQIGEWLAGGDR